MFALVPPLLHSSAALGYFIACPSYALDGMSRNDTNMRAIAEVAPSDRAALQQNRSDCE
jgi:hypothetical protein